MQEPHTHIEVLGLSFIEFSGRNPQLLLNLFDQMQLQTYRSEDMTMHTSGDVVFVSNPTNGGSAESFRDQHSRGASALGFKVLNAQQALERACSLGAERVVNADLGMPAIKGIGASIIYLVDDSNEQSLFDRFGCDRQSKAIGRSKITAVDHLTHNLRPGGIARIKSFYAKLFGFTSTRHFDIDGQETGLVSEVIQAPDGSVIIPLNETKDDKSQIAEFIDEYNGEGIQHIALLTEDLVGTVTCLKSNAVEFQSTPGTYYQGIDARLPGHGQNINQLEEHQILIDGGEEQGGGYLLQIFTKNSIGPIFFEYIQRIGNQGFGEGNFQALFESIELDQKQRGAI